jgi:hypothetical protein
MKVRSMLLGVLGVGLVGAMAVWAAEKEKEEKQGKEQKVALDQVPAAVKATILKEAEGGKVGDVEREVKDGKTVYEADVEKDGKEFELKVAEDGTLIAKKAEGKEKEEGDEENGKEEAIPADKVPARARDALKKQAGDAKITKYSCEKEDGVETFEGEWTTHGLACSATVTADGAIVEIEEQLAPKDVPDAVRKAVAKMLPGAEDVMIEKKMTVEYEVKGKVEGKQREVVLNAAGHRVEKDEGDDEHEGKETEEKEEK